jgi:hypothetical protein
MGACLLVAAPAIALCAAFALPAVFGWCAMPPKE